MGNHLSRLTCSVEASVNNVESNAPADLRIDMENVEILCTPSLPLTVGDFLTRNYLTTVKQYELEGQKGRKRFMFEIVKETNELDKVLGGEQGEEGSLEEVRLRGFFQNMRSKMVYDPLAMMNQETIGMIELGMMRSCWRRDGHENSEVFLRSEGLLDDQVCRPLLIHFNSEVRIEEERRTAGAKRQQQIGAERRTAHRLGIQEELLLHSLRSRPSARRFAPRLTSFAIRSAHRSSCGSSASSWSSFKNWCTLSGSFSCSGGQSSTLRSPPLRLLRHPPLTVP